jgi:protein SCO1/2
MILSKKNLVPLLALGAGALILSATAAIMLAPPLPSTGIRSSGVASIGGPFRLTTERGQILSDADLKGSPFAVFFGFTHCPDVCPTALFDISELLKDLGPDADKLRVLFVSIDPARDTPDLLRTYLESFDPRITALTGSEAEVQDAAKAYRAHYRRVPTGGDGYTMEHTAITYLMGRQGQFFSTLDPHESRDGKLAKLKRLIASG